MGSTYTTEVHHAESLREQHPAELVLSGTSILRALIAGVAVLFAAAVVMECLRFYLGYDHVLGLFRVFNMDTENNIPTWFSSIGLLACSVALAILAAVHRNRHDPPGRFFAVLAGVFVMLSLDEAASLHEMFLRPVRLLLHTSGFLYFAWVIPGGAFALAVAIWSWRSLKKLPSDTRFAMLTAGAVYCLGALGMEMIAAKYLTAFSPAALTNPNSDFGFSILVILEETLEMIGIILFLRALLGYFVRAAGSATIQVKD